MRVLIQVGKSYANSSENPAIRQRNFDNVKQKITVVVSLFGVSDFSVCWK